jgi:CRP/FNR family transcriptional regulator
MIDPKQVKHVEFLQHLSPAGRARLLQDSMLERYEKGALLFRQGDRAEFMWFVLEGWVHLLRSSEREDGLRSVVLFTITPDEVLCGISALESGRYQLSGVAATACRAIRVSTETLNATFRAEPEFAHQALLLCARRIQHIAQQYGAMAESVSKRIVRAILRLRQQFGERLPVTHRELAQMSWTTTESAIRVVRRLKRQGYVTGARGQLTIARPKALAQVLERRDGAAV